MTALLLSTLLSAVGVWMGATEYLPELALLLLAIPYLPLASLTFGALPAIVAWFASLSIIGCLDIPVRWFLACSFGLNRLQPGTDLPQPLCCACSPSWRRPRAWDCVTPEGGTRNKSCGFANQSWRRPGYEKKSGFGSPMNYTTSGG